MPDARAYYLTDNGYGKLVHMAQRARYVEFGASRVRGMSDFLNELCTTEFDDTRPELVRQRHEEEIAHGRAPTWMQNRNRRSRLLTLTDDAIARYFLVAYQVGIIRREPYAIGGPSRRTELPAVSLVLEAIGLGWITPADLPRGNK